MFPLKMRFFYLYDEVKSRIADRGSFHDPYLASETFYRKLNNVIKSQCYC